jgi:hypothetical protein
MTSEGAEGLRPSHVAQRVLELRRAVPADLLRFLVPDGDSTTDLQYLAILVLLQQSSRNGQDEVGHSEAVEDATQAIAALGESLSPEIVAQRLAHLTRCKVIDRVTELDPHDHYNFRRDYQRYRISAEGNLVLGMLEDADRRRRRPLATQDAANVLTRIHETLQGVLARVGTTGPPPEGNEGLQRAYLDLQSVTESHYPVLLEFLHALNDEISSFGIGGFDSDQFDALVNGLQRYMDGVHDVFEARSLAILETCRRLQDEEALKDLRLGRVLAEQQDPQIFHRLLPERPAPDDLLHRLHGMFDSTRRSSLLQEVRKVQTNTRKVVGRLRSHWQKLLDRTNFVQQLGMAWDDLKAIPWDDHEPWARAMAWRDNVYELSRIQTAPNLPREDGKGKPPMPQRRYVLKGRREEPMPVLRALGDPDGLFVDLDQETGRRLDRFVHERILRGRDEALLSDFHVATHDDFRSIVEVAKCSELVLHNGIAREHFTFRVAYVPGAPQVPWRCANTRYTAPEIRFMAKQNGHEKAIQVTHGP